jgi:hypothetical protein
MRTWVGITAVAAAVLALSGCLGTAEPEAGARKSGASPSATGLEGFVSSKEREERERAAERERAERERGPRADAERDMAEAVRETGRAPVFIPSPVKGLRKCVLHLAAGMRTVPSERDFAVVFRRLTGLGWKVKHPPEVANGERSAYLTRNGWQISLAMGPRPELPEDLDHPSVRPGDRGLLIMELTCAPS